MRPVIDRLVAELAETRRDFRLQLETRVIGAEVDAHARLV
jgi:hypothetical protein